MSQETDDLRNLLATTITDMRRAMGGAGVSTLTVGRWRCELREALNLLDASERSCLQREQEREDWKLAFENSNDAVGKMESRLREVEQERDALRAALSR